MYIDLFNFSFELKRISSIGLKSSFLKFDDVFEILWKLNIFPRLIAKSTIRYYYYYTVNNDEGLDFEVFV